MRKVIISTEAGFRSAIPLRVEGDWAVTLRGIGPATITHLPTGASVATGESEKLEAALPALAALPRFDLQGFFTYAVAKSVVDVLTSFDVPMPDTMENTLVALKRIAESRV